MTNKINTGQSLVEFIIIIPIFFLSMSGMIVIFQQQMRSFTDENAQTALSISEGHIEAEERTAANWSSANQSSQEILEEIVDKAINPSLAFPNTKDIKEGVFYEKLQVKNHLQCTANQPNYEINEQKKGSFDLTTCAGEKGYDRAAPGFSGTFQSKAQTSKISGSSLFYPQNDFAWPMRPYEVVNDVKKLFVADPSFSLRQASLIMPDPGFFNSQCFMEPFAPKCALDPIAGKFSRAAVDSSKIQLTACLVEGASKCTGGPPAIAACISAQILSLTLTLKEGIPSPLCPNLNSAVRATQIATFPKIATFGAITLQNENAKRAELLNSSPLF